MKVIIEFDDDTLRDVVKTKQVILEILTLISSLVGGFTARVEK